MSKSQSDANVAIAELDLPNDNAAWALAQELANRLAQARGKPTTVIVRDEDGREVCTAASRGH